MLNSLGVHHSSESWNPEMLLILQELLDSAFQWIDEESVRISFPGQTGKLEGHKWLVER